MLSNLKKPSALLVVERMTPVETFFASIEAPGTAASPGSVTVPCKVAVVVWAKTQPHKSARTQSICAIRFNDMIKPPNLNAKTHRDSPFARSNIVSWPGHRSKVVAVSGYYI